MATEVVEIHDWKDLANLPTTTNNSPFTDADTAIIRFMNNLDASTDGYATHVDKIGGWDPIDPNLSIQGQDEVIFDGNGKVINDFKSEGSGISAIFKELYMGKTNLTVKDLTIDSPVISGDEASVISNSAYEDSNNVLINNLRVIDANIKYTSTGEQACLINNLDGFSGGSYTFRNCFVSGEIAPDASPAEAAGFIAAKAQSDVSTTIDQCGVNGELVTSSGSGMFIGNANNVNVSNSYAIGHINAFNSPDEIGGMTGKNTLTISKSYVAVEITSPDSETISSKGAICAEGDLVNCVWNGDLADAPGTNNGTETSVKELTTDQMQGDSPLNNFTGFDFEDVWQTESNAYPELINLLNFYVETLEATDITTDRAKVRANMRKLYKVLYDGAVMNFEFDTDPAFPDPTTLPDSDEFGVFQEGNVVEHEFSGLDEDTQYYYRVNVQSAIYRDRTLMDQVVQSGGFLDDLIANTTELDKATSSQATIGAIANNNSAISKFASVPKAISYYLDSDFSNDEFWTLQSATETFWNTGSPAIPATVDSTDLSFVQTAAGGSAIQFENLTAGGTRDETTEIYTLPSVQVDNLDQIDVDLTIENGSNSAYQVFRDGTQVATPIDVSSDTGDTQIGIGVNENDSETNTYQLNKVVLSSS